MRNNTMWTLFKTEFIYNRFLLSAFFGFIVLAMIIMMITGYAEVRVLPGLTMGFFIAIAITTGVKMGEDKRERYVSLLPLTPFQIAVYRVLFYISIQGLMVLLWTAMLILHPPADLIQEILELSVLNGIILSFTFLIFLWDDLGFFQKRIYRIYLLLFILVLISAMFFFRFSPWVFSSSGTFHTIPEAVAVNLFWMSLCFFDVFLFTKRKSYLV